MYAELDLKFKRPIDSAQATESLKVIAGTNAIPIADALQGTPLQSNMNSALVAEQVLNSATVVYFMEGNDSIKVHIVVRSLAEARKQCSRLTRQVSSKIEGLSEAKATILVQVRGTDEAVLSAQRVSFVGRWWADTSDKFVSRFATVFVTFVLAAMLLPGSTASQSAGIGLVAALVAAVLEAAVIAAKSEEWKWKDLS